MSDKVIRLGLPRSFLVSTFKEPGHLVCQELCSSSEKTVVSRLPRLVAQWAYLSPGLAFCKTFSDCVHFLFSSSSSNLYLYHVVVTCTASGFSQLISVFPVTGCDPFLAVRVRFHMFCDCACFSQQYWYLTTVSIPNSSYRLHWSFQTSALIWSPSSGNEDNGRETLRGTLVLFLAPSLIG